MTATVKILRNTETRPRNKVADAKLHFEGNSLAIESTQGTVAGNPIEKVIARFPDFATGQLLIDGSVKGETARFYDFVSRSPVRETRSSNADRSSGCAAR